MKIPDHPGSGPLSSTLGRKSVSKSRSWGTEGTHQWFHGASPTKSKKRKRRKSSEEQPARMHFAPDRENRPLCGANSKNIWANEWNFRKDENKCQRCFTVLESIQKSDKAAKKGAAPKKRIAKLLQCSKCGKSVPASQLTKCEHCYEFLLCQTTKDCKMAAHLAWCKKRKLTPREAKLREKRKAATIRGLSEA